jgi:hypothetical protein
LYALDISGTLGPCALLDATVPLFSPTGGVDFHLNGYTGAQFNDRIYKFDLRDP